MIAQPEHAREALHAYDLSDATLTPITMGNINDTYAVRAPLGQYVLQRLNPIFKPEIHHDIAQVTTHLARAGLTTPRLMPTRDGQWWVTLADGGVWRLQTFIHGVVHSQAPQAHWCAAAGVLLARFHAALANYTEPFRAPRLGVHDTPKHLRLLRDALAHHTAHQAFSQVERLAHVILQRAERLQDMQALPERVVHGDAKLNNIIFAEDASARALIDLDTLNRMPITLELGDALRSWCNPQGENQGQIHFSVDYFAAALRGYQNAQPNFLTPQEVAMLPDAVETIALELASRFARDALEESYFGWDSTHYKAAWEHNMHRAQSQLALANSYAQQRTEVMRIMHQVFGSVF